MRIMMVSMASLVYPSPAREHLLGLVRALSSLGHELLVVTPEFGSEKDFDLPKAFITNTISHMPLSLRGNYNSPTQRRLGLLKFILVVPKVVEQLLNKYSVELVYVRYLPSMKRIAEICNAKSSKLIVEINNLVSDDRKSLGKSSILTPLLAQLEKKDLRVAESILCVTEKLRSAVIERYDISETRVHYAPNGVDVGFFDSIECLSENTRAIHDRKLVLGFGGNFSPWQGVELIPKAISLLRVDIKELVVVKMVGDGQVRRETEKIVKSYGLENMFYFYGSQCQNDYVISLKSFDICLAPYRGERVRKLGVSPIKIFSYMASKKPIICSDLDDLKFIDEYGFGRTFREGSAGDFAKAISEMVERRDELNKMGLKAYDYVAKHHDWKVIAERILDVAYGKESVS